MTVGQKIKKLRVENNLTQKDIADQLHVTYQTISKWEADQNEPDITTLKALSKIFNCSVDDLINENEVVEEETHEEGEERIEKATQEEPKPERIIIDKDTVKAKGASKAKKLTLIWSIVGAVIALGIALAIFLCNTETIIPGLGVAFSFVISYGIFSMLYCIMSGSYIGDVFLWCSSLSIKFPGLIFSWSIEGFAWLIAMKILFAVLGFLIGVAALLFAIVFSSTLGMISFPFVLIHNIKTNYEDSLFMPQTFSGGGRRGRRGRGR